ncbi:MAG: hypothetical protein ACTSRP_00835 [Candidatus Helarchaeota archaeon]
MIENPIKFIWIINNKNKILYQKNFIDKEGDIDLYLGFFSSIIKFADKVANDELESIEMKDSLINYHFADEFFIVIVTEKDVNLKKIKNLLMKIRTSFKNQYEGLYNTDNPEIFQHFDATMDIILKSTKL